MKRINLHIDDQTHASFKAKTAAAGVTMTEVLSAAINDYLSGKYQPKIKKPSKGTGKAKA